MAVGRHHQLIVVMPKLDIVAIMTGSSRFAGPNGIVTTPRYGFGTLVGYLAAAVTSDRAIAANAAATAELAERVKAAAIEQPVPHRHQRQRTAADSQGRLRQDLAVRR